MRPRRQRDRRDDGGSSLDPSETIGTSDVDIWAMRDQGFVRGADIEFIRKHFEFAEPLAVDYTDEPTLEQKEFVVSQYVQLAAYLNHQRMNDRSDWTPRQAWSVGRAATAQQWGVDPLATIFPAPWDAVDPG